MFSLVTYIYMPLYFQIKFLLLKKFSLKSIKKIYKYNSNKLSITDREHEKGINIKCK
jgi:hypothetical protein